MKYTCFIVPPHMEGSETKEVSTAIRQRRTGTHKMRQSVFWGPVKINLDDQDIFSSHGTLRLPGWKLADTHQQADKCSNKDVDICWDNTQLIMNYYKNVLGFDLKSNLDGQVVSTIDFGTKYNNAFFNGEQMAYGDGDKIVFSDFCHDLSVVCHELGHALIDRTVPLEYQGMSGALNESYADIFAICFMHYNSKKSFGQLCVDDWKIGAKCVVGEGALRSFTEEPARTNTSPLGPDTDPKNMSQFYSGTEDEGGVHINSGIINHLFYQVCKILCGPDDKTWEKPLKLWYKLLSEKRITKRCTFQEFAKALKICTDQDIGEAFKIVGLIIN
jgi:Zn-dependent metalloprotease